MMAHVDAAVDHVVKHGIGCTEQFEQTLLRDSNGMCLELMTALLEKGAETYTHYEPSASERHGGVHGKSIVTLFGKTAPIKRAYYHDEDAGSGHFPFDDQLGLVGRYAPSVAHEAARLAVRQSYAEASAEFTRVRGFPLSADTVRALVGATAEQMKAFEADGATAPCGQPPARRGLVYVMADGTGAPMRRKHLRGVKGKNGAAKTREVKAGAVFTGSKTSENEPHRNVGTTTYVATTDRREKFAGQFRGEFDRRHPMLPETTVFISDGAAWLESVHAEQFPFAVAILDFYHAVEHLRPLLLGLGFEEGSKEYRQRHRHWTERIRLGKIGGVLASIKRDYGNSLVGDARREYRYFERNAGRMKYDEYRANGWFIGTGVIESACKTVVGGRFKCSGMKWSLKGLKALLPLRTLYKSDRLEEFFRHTVKDLEQVKCA